MANGNQSNTVKTAAIALGAVALGKFLWRKMNEYDLRGKTVLVTGGSRGLGLVLAREFAANGARVAICARDEQELDQASDDLLSRGADVLAIKCDVTNMAEVESMVSRVRQRFGKIDVLVNNAGTIQVGPLEVMKHEDFEHTMRTHFWGPLNTILAVLPEMRERRDGRIVNISSIGGKIAVPHLVPYSASKFALRSEEHTSELQSLAYLVCRLLLEKKKPSSTPAACDRTPCSFRPGMWSGAEQSETSAADRAGTRG